MEFARYFLVGGAGFIGSYFIDALLEDRKVEKVTIFDNFSCGRWWHIQHHFKDSRITIIREDVKNSNRLTECMKDHDIVMHFASNSDISQANINPVIDFTNGVCLTHHVLESARLTKIKRILYFSGSGVYGDNGHQECTEDQGALYPVSPYGASKLAGEAFVSSYCHMFDMSACVFRFANVVGSRQTHGVAYDFIKKIISNPNELTILGNGQQSKSYIYIDDIIQAVLLANQKLQTPFEVYNVATGDYISVNDIANLVVEMMSLKNKVNFHYTGGSVGWKGDIPVVRLCTKKIRALGWECKNNSYDAMRKAVLGMLQNVDKGLLFSDNLELLF